MRYSKLIAAVLLAVLPVMAQASTDVCETQAAAASARHALPQGLLQAIARTESGRAAPGTGPRAWPWTANVAGRGFYFDSRDAALARLQAVLASGQTSFDVGCMQLNYRWHGDQFASLAAMIDPVQNTDYAARYLRSLYHETGDWETATRYYHSRTPATGAAYLARVQRAMAGLDQPPQAPGAAQTSARGTALVALSATPAYWDHPRLGAGAYPRMPD